MKICIKPSVAKGTLAAPPSKSYAHRLMICAALASGRSKIRGIAQSEDMLATLDCIRALGARCQMDRDTALIDGRTERREDGAVFACRESGSTLRFFLPLALLDERRACFTGTARLMERGVSVYETIFRERGIWLQRQPEALLVQGQLTSGAYRLRGDVSSQFVSGLLFALPLLDGDSTIDVLPPVESRAYIDITIDAMRRFGIRVEEISPNRFFVPGGQRYCPADAVVEGDWSNAAALLAFNNLGGDVTVTGLNPDSTQGDRVCLSLLDRLRRPDAQIDLSACPDLGPVLFAVAAAGHGASFSGTARLRIKESDRAQTMADELKKFGIYVMVEENAVRVLPGTLSAPSTPLDGHNDHRIVMALSVLASQTGGTITGAQAINKSFPTFFDTLEQLGLELGYDFT